MPSHHWKLLLAAALSAVVPVTYAHAVLTQATPRDGSVVTKSPAEIRLAFNEALEGPFSRIVLSDQRGAAVITGKAVLGVGQPNVLVLPLAPLKAGKYLVNWSTMTRDGHRTKGHLAFTVP